LFLQIFSGSSIFRDLKISKKKTFRDLGLFSLFNSVFFFSLSVWRRRGNRIKNWLKNENFIAWNFSKFKKKIMFEGLKKVFLDEEFVFLICWHQLQNYSSKTPNKNFLSLRNFDSMRKKIFSFSLANFKIKFYHWSCQSKDSERNSSSSWTFFPLMICVKFQIFLFNLFSKKFSGIFTKISVPNFFIIWIFLIF